MVVPGSIPNITLSVANFQYYKITILLLMHAKIPYKKLTIIIKFLIIVMSVAYIYHKLFRQNNFDALINQLNVLQTPPTFLFLSITFVLLFFNWSLEAYKWKYLLNSLEKISFTTALKGVLTGVTISVFTPNRIGDFGGRIFMLQSESRIKAIGLSFIGNAAQTIVTLITGLIGFIYYFNAYTTINKTDNPHLFYAIVCIVLLLIPALLFFYFNIDFLKSILKKIKSELVDTIADKLNALNTKQMITILILSIIRYSVFSLQFFILLKLFNIDLSVLEGFIMIACTFFAITAIPTFAFTEIGVRSSAALAFIGAVSTNTVGILSAALLLWVINIAIPALIGSLFVFKLRFFSKKDV